MADAGAAASSKAEASGSRKRSRGGAENGASAKSSSAPSNKRQRAKDGDYVPSAAALAKSGGAALVAGGRKSGRVKGKTAADRVVDDATRQMVRNARISALDDDNYVEDTGMGDAAYVDGEEDEKVDMVSRKSKKSKKKGLQRTISATATKHKSLEQLFMDSGIYEGASGVHYYSAAARPATRPPRHFCSVCGFSAAYTCPRCGERFCCIKCQNQHKETRCLKFTA